MVRTALLRRRCLKASGTKYQPRGGLLQIAFWQNSCRLRAIAVRRARCIRCLCRRSKARRSKTHRARGRAFRRSASISVDNRTQLLRSLEREKQRARVKRPRRKGYMIKFSRPQLSFAEGLIQEEVAPLWEDWMRQVDQVLLDPQLLSIVYEALARRWPKSRTCGRPGTPADVVLRLLLLMHIRNWTPRWSRIRRVAAHLP
jgi:hypothetical protein